MAVRAIRWEPGGGPPSEVATTRLLNGRYQIDRLLGCGGMAAVWRGRDLRLDRPVAIKELSGDGLRQARALERFDLEARAVARLSHPNVVSIYDSGTEGGAQYLVMELVDGPTVAKLLAGGPLPVADVLAVAAQVCDGLAAAHLADIVHRDIKPANLMLTRGGLVKICDFGVARLLDPTGRANLTGPATVMGSPSYMAPEQIAGRRVDRRTDLYALGCTMYAMLSGKPPFSDGGPFAIVHEHLTARPEPLRVHRPDVPPEVEALIADLLAKQPDQRPPDAPAVRARIAAAQAAFARSAQPRPAAAAAPVRAVVPSSEAAPATAVPDSRRPRVSGRRWVVAAAGAALSAALVAIAGPVLLDGAGERTDPWTSLNGALASSVAPSAVASASPIRPSRGPGAINVPTAGSAPPSPTTQPPSPVDPVVALRQAVAQQVATGDLKPDAATDLNHMIDDLTKTIATGSAVDVANKIKALRAKLTTQHNEGKLSDAGHAELNSAVDQVAAAQA
jgi:eukaryotic-like serine/threonine-protein kinase